MGTERRTGGGREADPGVPGSEGQPRGATGRGLRGPGGIPPFSPRLPVPRARTSGSRRGEASSAAPRRPQAGGGARSAAGRGAPGPPPPPAPRPWRRRRRLRSGGRPLPSPHPEARPHLPEPESTPGRPVRAPPRRYRALAAGWARFGARPPPVPLPPAGLAVTGGLPTVPREEAVGFGHCSIRCPLIGWRGGGSALVGCEAERGRGP